MAINHVEKNNTTPQTRQNEHILKIMGKHLKIGLLSQN